MITEWLETKNNFSVKGSMDFSIKELETFTPMETAFRNYFRMTHGLDVCDAKEKLQRKQAYDLFSQRFLCAEQPDSHAVLPDTKDMFFINGPIRLMKHARYIPAHVHSHEFIEMFYVMKGQCEHICDGIHYPLHAGDFCLWQFNAPHYIHSDSDDCIAINILVQKPAFQRYFLGVLSEQSILNDYFNNILYGKGEYPMILFRTGEDLVFRALIYDMYRESEEQRPYCETLLCSQLNFLFIHLLRRHQSHISTAPGQKDFDPTLEILKYIQDHSMTVTLNDLSREFHYTEAYLSRLIKRKSGRNFSQLMNEQRMTRAAWLLTNTEKSIRTIALEVNCSDTSHFCRIFTKAYHMSPGSYRKEHAYKKEHSVL